MAEQTTLERQIGEVDYRSGGGTETLGVPRSHYFHRLNIVTDYQVTTAAGAEKRGNGILELLQNLEVKIDGNQVVKSLSGPMSHKTDWMRYGTRPLYDPIDFSTADTETGKIQTFIDFVLDPNDFTSLLPAFETSDFTFSVNWGTGGDIGSNTTVDSASASVGTLERRRGSVAEPNSPEEDDLLSELAVYKEREKRTDLSSAGETTIELPRGNIYYGVPFETTNNGVPNDSLIKSLRLTEEGINNHKEIPYSLQRAKDFQDFHLESLPDGFVYPNFFNGEKTDLTDVVETGGMDSWELVVDTESEAPAGESSVRTLTQELIV